MTFHGQQPFQYMPPAQSQHVNAVQPPFGPGSFSVNGSAGPASFNDLPLPGEQGAFAGHDFAPASTQSHDQPQNAGSFRAFSSQLVQLEFRLEGRFQEIRLRAQSADMALAKLEDVRTRLDDLETSVTAVSKSLQSVTKSLYDLETSMATLSKSSQTVSKNLDKLDLRAERSIDDAYGTISLLIDIVAKQLHINPTDLGELRRYQQRGEIEN